MDGPVTEGAPETADAPSTKVDTLPPPEWSGPILRGRRSHTPPPRARGPGRGADEAQRRARLEGAAAAKNAAQERDLCAQLARWLAARERDLDDATRLAQRALAIEEVARPPLTPSDELRRELSA